MWNHIAIIGYNNDLVFCVAEGGELTELIITNILDTTSLFTTEFPIEIKHVVIASYYGRAEYASVSDTNSENINYTPIEIYQLFTTMIKTPYIKIMNPHLQSFKIFTWGNTVSSASLELYNKTLEKYSRDYFLLNS
jgi:hypothetical protein